MRIVHLIARLNDGGPARVLRLLAQYSQQAGHDCHIITGATAANEPDIAPDLIAQGLRVHQLQHLARKPSIASDWRAFWEAYRLLRQLRPNILHTHTAKAGMLGRPLGALCGITTLHTYHGHVLHGYWHPLVHQAIQLSERLVSRLAHCHSLTPGQVRELRDYYHVGDPHRWHGLPIPIEAVNPITPAWAPQGAQVLGFLGRLAPVKDIGLWLDAVAQAAESAKIQGLVCGDGEERTQAEKRAQQLPCPVRFTGFIPAAEALAAMDCLVISSRNEGMPLTAIEAMSAGVPVVACRVGGLAELPACAAFHPCERSAADMSRAISAALAANPAAVRAAGQTIAAHFAPERVVPRYLERYHRILPS